MPNETSKQEQEGLDERTLQKFYANPSHVTDKGWREVIDALRTTRQSLTKIDAIRNSIVGYQSINWSAHIYPLVAALEEAGFHGLGYEDASRLAKTQVEHIAELGQQAQRDRERIEELEELLNTGIRSAISGTWETRVRAALAKKEE